MDQQVTLVGVSEAAEAAWRELAGGATTVVLSGQAGAGKSSTLRELAASKRPGIKDIVLVAPPQGEDSPDAGLVALVELAAQLDDQKLLAEVKRNDITWKGKLRSVTRQLETRAARTLLLFDEPLLSHGPDLLSSVFTDRAAEFSRAVLGVKGLKKVVATSHALPEAREVAVVARSLPEEVLAPGNWGDLAPAAEQVLKAGGQGLAAQSPLELRLRVGLVAAGAQVSRAVTPPLALHKLVAQLLAQVGEGAEELKKVLGRLALLRIPFDEFALGDMGAEQLTGFCRQLLRRVLLFGTHERLQLHEAIAREAVQWRWLGPGERQQAHRLAARYHDARYTHCAERFWVRQSVRHELEVIHHLTHAGDATRLLQRSLFFVEQYDALGRVLSQQRRHDEAVQAYERALAHDANDAYAHHYLGYNLDILAQEPQRVEQQFKAAIQCKGDHVWYHGRFINFLVTRGRVREARNAWEDALNLLLPAGSSTDERLYRELHGELARLLLHRGQLDFALDVLEDVPPLLRERLPWYRALRRLHSALVAAASDEEVFPPNIAPEEFWKGPHLLHRAADKPRVERWMPGRVAAADSSELHLRVATPPAEAGAVSFAWYDLSLEQYRRLAQDLRDREEVPSAGTFVEIIKLQGEEEFLRLHPVARFDEPELPALFPPPDRYLRRGPAPA